MKPLAGYAAALGCKVTGSDLNKNKGDLSDNIKTWDFHSREHLAGVDIAVYSSAIPTDHPEIMAAKNKGIPLLHRSEAISILTRDHSGIFIAGSHGKTTTSAMLCHCLHHLKKDPKAIIGAKILSIDSDFLCGEGKDFVVEADESDGSFLNYSPSCAFVTNIDHDHLDFYGTLQGIEEAFGEFILNTAVDGSIVVGWDNKSVRNMITANKEELSEKNIEIITYGKYIGCDNRILSIHKIPGGTKFECILGKEIVAFSLPLMGNHNVDNALSVISYLRVKNVSNEQIQSALSTFKGVKRRLEVKEENSSRMIIDDYAHNPTKISSAIQAVKSHYENAHISVIFQPHRYSRLSTMYDMFCKSFIDADTVIVTPIFSAGERCDKNLNHHKLAIDISSLSAVKAHSVDNYASIKAVTDRETTPFNVILILGAGDTENIYNCIKDN